MMLIYYPVVFRVHVLLVKGRTHQLPAVLTALGLDRRWSPGRLCVSLRCLEKLKG